MTTPKHIVFLTGAGISAESGLSTFRGEDGVMLYRKSGKTFKEGSPLNERKASENYIIWR